MSWEVSCPTFTVLTPWRNSFSAHTKSSFSSWLYSTSRSFGLEVCGEWMGGVEGVRKMGRWYVCVWVGRWRWAESGTHSRIATPLALFLAMSIIKPYPHAITLNSCHSNQPHPIIIVKLVTVTIWSIVVHCLLYSDKGQIMCAAYM